jgi:hypothetical protein
VIAEREQSAARWVNLLIPGGGLMMIGRVWFGLVIALLFTLCANCALAFSLLFPDDVPSWAGGLATGLAGGTYLGAQLRFAQTVRSRRHGAANTRRRQALEATRACLAAGRYDQAWEAIRPLAAQAERDLLVAYRVAQVLTAKQDVDAALGAWQLVRRLDRHHVYREQIRSSERALSRVAQPALSPEAPFGRGDA